MRIQRSTDIISKELPVIFYQPPPLLSPAYGVPTTHSLPKISENRVFNHPIKKRQPFRLSLGAFSGARTLDPNIKSVVLYQLS